MGAVVLPAPCALVALALLPHGHLNAGDPLAGWLTALDGDLAAVAEVAVLLGSAPSGTRTPNARINSQLRCHMS